MPSETHPSLAHELEKGLRGLEAQSQLRSLTEISGVNLCSNDYLGLSENAELKEAVLDAVRKTTLIGGTGSRLLSGHARVWEELEEVFAKFAGTESALYFGSGYTANIGLLTSLAGKHNIIFSDTLNHASIIDGVRLSGARKIIYPHLDVYALEALLRSHGGERCRKLIVTESVFSMNGDVAPLEKLSALAERYGAELIVDEAHATGVHGPGGRGLVVAAGRRAHAFATVHTCGKALASAGAFVCGPSVLKEHLINHARTFIFSTAMPPYMAGQIRAALHLASKMDAQREALLDRARRLASALAADGWDTCGAGSQIVPVVIGKNEDTISAAEHLQRGGFAVRAIRPPTVPAGSARLRFSLTAAISQAEIDRLQKSLSVWRAQQQTPVAAGHA